MSITFTNKLKSRVIALIKADMKFREPEKFIDDLYIFADTLMTEDEKSISKFLRDGCPGFYGSFYSHRGADAVLGRYFRGKNFTIPERLFGFPEFKKKVESIKLATDEFMETVRDVERAVNSCNGFREFNQLLPQFKGYLEKAKEELYGTSSKTQNLPAKPIEIENLGKYLKVENATPGDTND